VLKLCDGNCYYVFPTYWPEFRNMMPWLADWERAFAGSHRFWHGFDGGGVLSVPQSIPGQQRHRLVLGTRGWGLKPVYGMVLGNEGGRRLANCLSCVEGDRPLAFAVKTGLAERVPDPTVKTTAEHVESLVDKRLVLVVPKANRKNIKLLESLPKWFATFGIEAEPSPCELPLALHSEMVTWFSDPARVMFAFRIFGGEENAAWQTAVTYYIAEYWDTTVRGLDSLHFLARIDEKPCFRRNWTSNK
jgi:hypothetical protein